MSDPIYAHVLYEYVNGISHLFQVTAHYFQLQELMISVLFGIAQNATGLI